MVRVSYAQILKKLTVACHPGSKDLYAILLSATNNASVDIQQFESARKLSSAPVTIPKSAPMATMYTAQCIPMVRNAAQNAAEGLIRVYGSMRSRATLRLKLAKP